MNKRIFLLVTFCGPLFAALLRAQPLQYTLLAESKFMDDCLICGRPTITVPLHGTFMLVPEEVTVLFTKLSIGKYRVGRRDRHERPIRHPRQRHLHGRR